MDNGFRKKVPVFKCGICLKKLCLSLQFLCGCILTKEKQMYGFLSVWLEVISYSVLWVSKSLWARIFFPGFLRVSLGFWWFLINIDGSKCLSESVSTLGPRVAKIASITRIEVHLKYTNCNLRRRPRGIAWGWFKCHQRVVNWNTCAGFRHWLLCCHNHPSPHSLLLGDLEGKQLPPEIVDASRRLKLQFSSINPRVKG